MKTFHSIVLAVLFLITVGSGQSITVVPKITEADIINATVLVDPFAEKIKEIAPTTFSLRFINNNPANLVKISLTFEAFVTLEEDRQRVRIAFGQTKPFLVSGQFREFTSKDADNPGSDIDFVSKDLDNDMKTKLKNKVQDPTSGGRVPSGLYEVNIVVKVDSINGIAATSEPPIQPINLSVNVTNPTTTVLDVPFNNGYVYPTPFPQFQWTYDTRLVKLSVFELRPEHQSLEDAVGASNPYLEVMIDRKLSGNLSSFTYPQSSSSRPGVSFIRGPRQLERGRMYVIVLDGIMTAFGFDVAPIRTIRSFSIADPQGQVVINVLQTTFGGGEFQNIYNFIQDMDLQLNASGITLNGVTLSPQDLQKLLIENKDRIISVRFED
ncbi:MAG: hypothetical protein KA247_05735 [Bacteroidetes bacterium]|nr:hypothetical protein [Bacteroidota bacterium]